MNSFNLHTNAIIIIISIIIIDSAVWRCADVLKQ